MKEEFVHDCAQMELPPGREQGGEGGPPVPPAQSYRQLAPATLQLPKCPRLYPTLPIAPPGKTPLNPPLSPPPGGGSGGVSVSPPIPWNGSGGVSACPPHPLGWVWGCQRVPPPRPAVAPGSSLLSLPHGEGLLQVACPAPPPAQPPPQNGYPKPPYHSEYQGHLLPPSSPPSSGGIHPPPLTLLPAPGSPASWTSAATYPLGGPQPTPPAQPSTRGHPQPPLHPPNHYCKFGGV